MTPEGRPLLLSLDTATPCSSVAVTRGTLEEGEVLASLSLSTDVTHSRRLINSVEYLFSQTGLAWSDFDGIAVGLGPGSFTGLRIGMATAKGFATAAELPLLGVSSLAALAAGCAAYGAVWALLDARKKEVYAAEFLCRPGSAPQLVGEIRAVSPEKLASEIDGDILMVGDGVRRYASFWQEKLKERARFAPQVLQQISAGAIGLICGQDYLDANFLDLAEAEPLYVRASDAELSLAAPKND